MTSENRVLIFTMRSAQKPPRGGDIILYNGEKTLTGQTTVGVVRSLI